MNGHPSGCPPAVAAALERHAARRRAGLPTVSALAGPAGPAALAWRRWAAAAAVAQFVPLCYHDYDAAGPRELARRVVGDLTAAHDWPELAFRHLLRSAGQVAPPHAERLADQTVRHVSLLADAAAGRAGGEVAARVAFELCRLRLSGGLDRLDRDDLASLLALAPGRGDGQPWWRVLLAALDELLPATGRPAVLLTPPPGADAAAWLARTAEDLSRLAEAVPAWPVAAAVPSEALRRYAGDAPESRAKSLLLAGEVPIPVVGEPAIAERLRSAAIDPAEVSHSVRRLAESGAGESLVDAFAHAARLRPRRDDAARSAAERFLFELLESHPATAGRFVLNGCPGFAFGPRPAEVDLLAAGLRLAVEVDGYRHFTDPAGYRRDRRKDWELQRHGYEVVRVLADDVVARMEDVLDFVRAAVDHCERRPKGEAKP